jgi:hypothetical protein
VFILLVGFTAFNSSYRVLGVGIPLFLAMDRQIDLELLDCQTFKNRCMLVSYRVKNSGI